MPPRSISAAIYAVHWAGCAGHVAKLAAGRARAGLAAELATRISPRWSAWGRAEAGYDSGTGVYGRGMLGMMGAW